MDLSHQGNLRIHFQMLEHVVHCVQLSDRRSSSEDLIELEVL